MKKLLIIIFLIIATITIISIFTPVFALPVALAGTDIVVMIGSTVTLDGSSSYSETGNILTYNWHQFPGAGKSVILSSSSSAKCSFIAERMDILNFQLTVVDSNSGISRDTITVTVNFPTSDSFYGINYYPLEIGCTWFYDYNGLIANDSITGTVTEEIDGKVFINGKSCFEIHAYGQEVFENDKSTYTGEKYKCFVNEDLSLKEYAYFSPGSPGTGMTIFSLKRQDKFINSFCLSNKNTSNIDESKINNIFGLINFMPSNTSSEIKGLSLINPSSYTALNPPYILLKFSAAPETRWIRTQDYTLGTITSRVTGYRRVSVPAGTFDCVEISNDWVGGLKIIEWYSNYGLIKRYIYSPSMPMTDQQGNQIDAFYALWNYELRNYYIPADIDIPETPKSSSINIAYPNPIKLAVNNKICFKNITSDYNIKIFTISGKLVKTIVGDDNYGVAYWDAKNINGEPVANGVYIYVVTSPTGTKKTGKLAIIR